MVHAEHISHSQCGSGVHVLCLSTSFHKAKDNIKAQPSDSHTASGSEIGTTFQSSVWQYVSKREMRPRCNPAFTWRNLSHRSTHAHAQRPQPDWRSMPVIEKNRKQPTCPPKCAEVPGHCYTGFVITGKQQDFTYENVIYRSCLNTGMV